LRQRLDQNKSAPIDSSSLYKIAHITLLICGTWVISGHGDLVTNTDIRVTLCQAAHKTASAYAGYAKRTIERALSATRKRHAHRLANAAGTEFRNETRNRFRNEDGGRPNSSIKVMKGQ